MRRRMLTRSACRACHKKHDLESNSLNFTKPPQNLLNEKIFGLFRIFKTLVIDLWDSRAYLCQHDRRSPKGD